MMPSVVGEKVRKRIILPIGRIILPKLSRVSLSLTVSQSTELNLVYRVYFCISLKVKLSSTVARSRLGSVVLVFCS